MNIVLFIIIVLFEIDLVIMGNKPYKIEEEELMNKTALTLALEMVSLSEEISELCTQKAYATTQKIDEILDQKIDIAEIKFHEIKDILGKITV